MVASFDSTASELREIRLQEAAAIASLFMKNRRFNCRSAATGGKAPPPPFRHRQIAKAGPA
jgi:hypothetical protein